MIVVKRSNESLGDYVNRFTKETVNIPDLYQYVVVVALTNGIIKLKKSLTKKPPKTMDNFQAKAGTDQKVDDVVKVTSHMDDRKGKGQ